MPMTVMDWAPSPSTLRVSSALNPNHSVTAVTASASSPHFVSASHAPVPLQAPSDLAEGSVPCTANAPLLPSARMPFLVLLSLHSSWSPLAL
eukprot:2817885-Rhodomonas_salina.1